MAVIMDEWEETPDFCTRCKKLLTKEFVWLELDRRDNTYHDRQDIPEEHSQGWFKFGKDCAKTLMRK